MKPLRYCLALALAFAFLALPLNLAPASAATVFSYAPDAPKPVNVLPSTVAHARQVGVPASFVGMAQFMYAAQQNPAFWDAVRDRNAGQTLTPARNNVITTVQARTRVPTAPFAAAARSTVAAGGAFLAADLGISLGVGVVDVFWQDRQGIICNNVGDDPLGRLVAFVGSADCTASPGPSPEYIANLDAAPTLEGVVTWTSTTVPADQVVVSYRFVLGQRLALFGCSPDYTVYYPAVTLTADARTSPTAYPPMNFGVNDGSGGATFSTATTPLTSSETYARTGCSAAFNGISSRGNLANWTWNVSPGTISGFTPSAPPPTSVPSNPTRTMQCVIVGTDGITYSGSGIGYTELDDAWPTPDCPALPEGVLPGVTRLISTLDGSPPEVLLERSLEPAVEDWATTHPNCVDLTCATELVKGQTNCHVVPSACLDWFDDPVKNDTYQCRYGGSVVPLDECNIYAPGFSTSTPPDQRSTTLGDPATGAPMPNPSPPAPPADPSTLPVENAPCFPEGWAVLNPVEWVLKPVQCALRWAFVPREAVMLAHVDTFRGEWETSPPGQIAAKVVSLVPALAPSGCEGIPFDLSWVGDLEPGFAESAPESVQLLEACPGDVLHPWSIAVNVLLSGGVIVLGVRVIVGLVSRVVGYVDLGAS